MTHESLQQILNTVTCNGMRELTEERVLEAMKEAANKMNDECAKMSSIWMETTKSILKLKIK